MRRSTVLAPLVALVLTACGADTTSGEGSPAGGAAPAPTPSAAVPDGPTQEADRARVQTLYADYAAASTQGSDGFGTFVAAANHPEYAFTPEECRATSRAYGRTEAHRVIAEPDVDELTPDPDWTLPPGERYSGLAPSGRLYVLPVRFVESDTGRRPSDVVADVHVAVVDGRAHFSEPCEVLPAG